MSGRKCPSQLDPTLNIPYPASSLVQSPCNDPMSPCVKRAHSCPEHAEEISVVRLVLL